MKYSFEGAHATLAVLVITALVSLLASWNYFLAQEMVVARGTRDSNLKAKNTAQADLFGKLVAPDGAGPLPKLECPQATAQYGLATVSRQLCIARDLGATPALIDGSTIAPPLFPQINWATLYGTPSSCSMLADPSNNKSALGYALTPKAVRSRRSCTASPAAGLEFWSSEGNLSGSFTIPPGSTRFVMGALGYFEGQVKLNREAVLYAGGDLHLNALTSTALSPIHVTLLAGTGVVQVEQIVGAVKLQVWGRAGVYLPSGVQLAPAPIPVPTLERLVIGG